MAEKTRIGDWEGDWVIGKDQQGALVTLADRASRYTLSGLVKSKHAEGVTTVIQSLLEPHCDRCCTITLDNGLIQQYFPKTTNLLKVTLEQVTFVINQMNHRPRKCLDWKTPHEVFFGQPSTWSMSVLNVALRM